MRNDIIDVQVCEVAGETFVVANYTYTTLHKLFRYLIMKYIISYYIMVGIM